MNIKFLIIGTIILLTSCSSRIKQLSDNSSDDKRFKTLDTIVPFSGFWVNGRYLSDLKKNRSPRLSQGDYESCIEIPLKTLQVTRMIWGFYDGGADLTVVKNGDHYQFNFFTEDTVGDFVQNIEIISKDKIKIGANYFIRSNEKILEDNLFKGDYIDDNGKLVRFTGDGQVTGLDNYNEYSPTINYAGPGLEVDEIDFKESDKDYVTYGFKFVEDSLLIYTLNCIIMDSVNNFCESVDFGEIKYKLLKKK